MTIYTKFTAEEMASWPEGHKRCRGDCQEVKPLHLFGNNKATLFGKDTKCKECRKPKSKSDYQKTTLEYRMHHAAKNRAKKYGVPFTFDVGDIVIPEVCPVFGTEFQSNNPDLCATLDRIIPSKGYVPGNVVVISGRANRIKSDAAVWELFEVGRWLFNMLKDNEPGACEVVDIKAAAVAPENV